jgi:hypothetical protein
MVEITVGLTSWIRRNGGWSSLFAATVNEGVLRPAILGLFPTVNCQLQTHREIHLETSHDVRLGFEYGSG